MKTDYDFMDSFMIFHDIAPMRTTTEQIKKIIRDYDNKESLNMKTTCPHYNNRRQSISSAAGIDAATYAKLINDDHFCPSLKVFFRFAIVTGMTPNHIETVYKGLKKQVQTPEEEFIYILLTQHQNYDDGQGYSDCDDLRTINGVNKAMEYENKNRDINDKLNTNYFD